MALKYGIFAGTKIGEVDGIPISDRAVDQDYLARLHALLYKNGVIWHAGTVGQVAEKTGLTVTMHPVDAVIDGFYAYDLFDADLTLPDADALLPTVCAVGLRLNRPARCIERFVKAGTNGARPALTNDADVHELALAFVTVPAAATAVTNANIEDVREDESVCGIVTAALTSADASGMFLQQQAMLAQLRAAIEAAASGAAPNGFYLYTHSYDSTAKVHHFVPVTDAAAAAAAGAAAGAGANGKALLTAEYHAGDTFAVNGTACPAYVGADACDELPAGRWVTFVYDGTQLNFKAGGAALGFAVAGGTTRPTAAKKGTIWAAFALTVGTVTADVTAPASPAAGDVWVALDTQSDAPITLGKKPTAIIYPRSVQQYSGSAWVGYDAEVYTGSAWVALPFATYLYSLGDECAALTGGWGAYGSHGGWTITEGIRNGDHLTVGPGANTGQLVMFGTINAISLAKASTISVDYVKRAAGTTGAGYKLKLCVSTSKADPVVSTGVVASIVLGAAVSAAHVTATLDVSALSGSYYIWVQSSSPDVGDVYSVSMK